MKLCSNNQSLTVRTIELHNITHLSPYRLNEDTNAFYHTLYNSSLIIIKSYDTVLSYQKRSWMNDKVGCRSAAVWLPVSWVWILLKAWMCRVLCLLCLVRRAEHSFRGALPCECLCVTVKSRIRSLKRGDLNPILVVTPQQTTKFVFPTWDLAGYSKSGAQRGAREARNFETIETSKEEIDFKSQVQTGTTTIRIVFRRTATTSRCRQYHSRTVEASRKQRTSCAAKQTSSAVPSPPTTITDNDHSCHL